MQHEFRKYSRKGFAEARDLLPSETLQDLQLQKISVSAADEAEVLAMGERGKVFRNPENPQDQWYVAKAFFQKNYNTEPME